MSQRKVVLDLDEQFPPRWLKTSCCLASICSVLAVTVALACGAEISFFGILALVSPAWAVIYWTIGMPFRRIESRWPIQFTIERNHVGKESDGPFLKGTHVKNNRLEA